VIVVVELPHTHASIPAWLAMAMCGKRMEGVKIVINDNSIKGVSDFS
jgi:hypothetical protein